MFLGLGVGVCGFLGLGRLRSEFLGFWVGIRDHAFRVQGFELCSLYFQIFRMLGGQDQRLGTRCQQRTRCWQFHGTIGDWRCKNNVDKLKACPDLARERHLSRKASALRNEGEHVQECLNDQHKTDTD